MSVGSCFDQRAAFRVTRHGPRDLIRRASELLHQHIGIKPRQPPAFLPFMPDLKQHGASLDAREYCRTMTGVRRSESYDARLTAASCASSRSAWAQNSLQTKRSPTGSASTRSRVKQNGSLQ